MIHQHGQFNRHEVFQKRDITLVLDIIGKIRYSKSNHDNLVNMLFGLFDGIWYYGVGSAIDVTVEVPTSLKQSFQKLIKRVESAA